MNSSLRFSALAVLAAVAASCAPSMPEATASRHLVTEGAGFAFVGQPRRVSYTVAYRPQNLEPGAYTAVVAFDNPQNPAQPLQVVKAFTAPLPKLSFVSPGLDSIRTNHRYAIRTVIHQGGVAGPVVDRHVQEVHFGVNQQTASALGLATRLE